MHINESVIVAVSFSDNHASNVLIVGRNTCGKTEVINAFVGEEAEALYKKLTNFGMKKDE